MTMFFYHSVRADGIWRATLKTNDFQVFKNNDAVWSTGRTPSLEYKSSRDSVNLLIFKFYLINSDTFLCDSEHISAGVYRGNQTQSNIFWPLQNSGSSEKWLNALWGSWLHVWIWNHKASPGTLGHAVSGGWEEVPRPDHKREGPTGLLPSGFAFSETC